MKLTDRYIDKEGQGQVTLLPEESEDMWYVYNLISVGDSVRSTAIRKVQTESTTGSTASHKVRTTLTISVEHIDFDTQACVLRLRGRNIEDNEYVKMGAYHTLDIALNRKFTLKKQEWDSISLEHLETACNPEKTADLAAMVMQNGLSHLCLITNCMTSVKAKIEMNIPRKRKGFIHQHEKGLIKFYDTVIQSILRHIDFDVVKCIVIASPGFVKDQFYEYMLQVAVKMDYKVLLENKSKFILVPSSSGFKHSLQEALQAPGVSSKISDTKALGEVKALEEFYAVLQCEPDKAFYGKKHVTKAIEGHAVETLLISDSLFRCEDVNIRKEYVKLVDSVREFGGVVKIFSSMHVSGEQLEQLTGIAAVLRFPMPEIEGEESDTED